MRSPVLIFFLAYALSCFSQNKVALVTNKKGEAAYFNLQKGITYIEKNPDPVPCEAICKFNNGFARARRLSLFYFIDETGKAIFNTPPFEKAEDFHENFAQVKLDGKWGFINRKGEMAIKPQFYEAGHFSSGLSEVALSPKGKHGFIDTLGNLVIEPQFDNAMPFIGDRTWVSLNGKWGIIDRKGKFIITPTYKAIKDIFDPFNVWVPEYDYVTGLLNQQKNISNLAWIMADGKWGLINKSGKTLVPAIYTEVKDINEGYTWVKKDAFWGLIDSTGNYLIKPDERNPLIYAANTTFKVFSGFHNGLLRYQSRNLYGYMDKQLNVVIPAKYDKASDFKNGLACVYQDGYCGLIDVKGKTVIPINYKEIIIGNDELFPAKDDNGDWGYLNLKNEWVVKPRFKNASPFVITYYN